MEDKTYRVGGYHKFMINDPKERKIEALSFRDRVVQHCLCDNILKHDIRHYFDSIDHEILKGMLRSIPDRNVLGLLKCMESSMRQCIGQRNPVPFLRRHP